MAGFAALAGPPIAGALVHTYGGYTQAIVFTGVVIMVGALLFAAARYDFAKDRLVA